MGRPPRSPRREKGAPGSFREARRDLRRLRKLPAEKRPEKVRRARTRFRTPEAIALFLELARKLLDRSPDEAFAWLNLAREGALGVPAETYSVEVAAALLLQVDAHRANAMRVAGDLAAADAVWVTIHAGPAAGGWPTSGSAPSWRAWRPRFGSTSVGSARPTAFSLAPHASIEQRTMTKNAPECC